MALFITIQMNNAIPAFVGLIFIVKILQANAIVIQIRIFLEKIVNFGQKMTKIKK
jgi:hypothetical protein